MGSSADRPTGRPRTIDPDAVSLVALRMFDDQGFDAVSMDDVAAAAGVSRRSLFRLFPSKAALVWGGLDEFAARFTAALRDRPGDEPVGDALRAAYRAAAAFPEDILETTRHRLRVIRANPGLAPGGAEAIDVLAESRFDLVLLDLSMPEVDGLMVLEQIREWTHLNGMPVVVYSAVDDEETRRKAMRLGAAAYLQKGNTAWDELSRIVKRHVDQNPPPLGGGSGHASGMDPSPRFS